MTSKLIAIPCMLTISVGCAARKPVAIQIQDAKILAKPALVRRPMDPVLGKFGKMIRVYMPSLDERPIEIEIDFLPNETGIEKELPYDIGPYVRAAVEKIGKPFVTIRTNWDLLKNPAGSILGLQQDRPKPPPADFKMVGSLQRASECLVEGYDNRIDALAGNGSSQLNGSMTKERRQTETCLTLTLSLEVRNGQAVRSGAGEI
jgi:hypothetical protein